MLPIPVSVPVLLVLPVLLPVTRWLPFPTTILLPLPVPFPVAAFPALLAALFPIPVMPLLLPFGL
jgi:hypothetical protein